MISSRSKLILVLSAFWLGVGSLVGASFPFIVDSPDGAWRTNLVHRPMNTGNVMLEAMVIGGANLPRYVILSSPLTESESLLTLGRRLKSSLSPGQDPAAEESEAKKFGFEGRELKFELADSTSRYACDLFVFLQEKIGWGVLYFGAKDSPPPAHDPFQLFRPDAPVPEGVVGLAPFRVKDDPVTGFPISFELEANRANGRIARITVREVPPYSVTEREGVLVGDEVIAINGRKTQDFPIGIGKKSELGQIFLNRTAGDEVQLELISPGDTKTRKVTLRIPDVYDGFPRIMGRR